MFYVDFGKVEELEKAMKAYEGDTANAINEILHNEASPLIQEEIKRLMPVSGRDWKGKAIPAKRAKSLTAVNGNLSVTVKTTKKYQYLYFPDDGSNTKNHAGNQQFFLRGGEAKKSEIIERCINRLSNDFENL